MQTIELTEKESNILYYILDVINVMTEDEVCAAFDGDIRCEEIGEIIAKLEED